MFECDVVVSECSLETEVIQPRPMISKGKLRDVQSGTFVADETGCLISVNQVFVYLLGCRNKKDLIGRNLAKVIYSGLNTREAFLTRIKTRGFVRNDVVQTLRKDGQIVYLSFTGRYVRNAKERIIGVEGVIREMARLC